MVLIGLPISLVAQEVPDPLTAGYSQCKFLPGKGMESLEEYIELFNEELDKAGIEMNSAMLMPFFKTNISEYDVLWVNTWEDNTQAGKAMDLVTIVYFDFSFSHLVTKMKSITMFNLKLICR